MKKIKDIRANTTSYGENYILDNQLTGRILISEDNTFEGIIFHEEESFLVLGNINDKTIEMLQKRENGNRLFRVQKDGETYYGDCFIKENDFEYPIGESIMSITEPNSFRKPYILNEIEEIEEQIKSKKSTRK